MPTQARLRKRSGLKTKSLIRATIIPFCAGVFLFLFIVTIFTVTNPRMAVQPKHEISTGILTVLR
jgi:hypothetical protein